MSEERKPEVTDNRVELRAEDRARAGISRREFARRAALASAPAIVVPAIAAWSPAGSAAPVPEADGIRASATQAAAASSAQVPTTPTANPQAAILPKLSAEGQAEVDARIQSILGQYGSRFSEEQKSDIRRLCTLAQPPLDRLRAYHLENGDGPALYLKPLVEREKKPATASSQPAAKKS